MKEGQVIIIKKQRGHGHGHHGGAWWRWHFVTAMMAFFLVMWIAWQSAQAVRGDSRLLHDPGSSTRRSPTVRSGAGGHHRSTPTPRRSCARRARSRRTTRRSPVDRGADSRAAARGADRASRTRSITVTKDGPRIELLESNEGQFFDPGAPARKPYTERALAIVARLSPIKNSAIVEGHTDSRLLGSDRYTNWELSADRANAARRVMERGGLYPGQVQGVRGFADTHLRIANAPEDSANRRVSIIVQNLYRPELLPEGAARDASTGTGAPDAEVPGPGGGRR
ncbi:MAG: OmpA family protein [Vicinamibacterales bacterium]